MFAAILAVCLWIGFRDLRRSYRLPVRLAHGVLRLVAFAIAWYLGPVLLFMAITWRTTFAEDFMPRVAENGNRIVEAVKRFEREKGWQPYELQDLVPDYLSEIPPTGCPSDDTWYYERGWLRWRLSVGVNTFSTYDEILYLSAGEPDPPAKVTSRYGDWMYVEVFD